MGIQRRRNTMPRFFLEELEQRRLLSGEFDTIHLDAGAAPESIVCADFNADGMTDTAVLAPATGEIVVWSPDGAGGFSEWAVIEGELGSAQRLQILDVDADMMPDLGFFDAASQRFTTYRNNGDGTFSFAGGLQLADTATGFALLYGGFGPVAEPVGPWLAPDGMGGDGSDGGMDGGEGGDGGDGGEGDEFDGEQHFAGDPYLAIWHESLGAVEIVDSLDLLDGGSDGGGSGGGEEQIVPWPFGGSFVALPSGVYFATGSGGDAVAMGDFDGDHAPDLALTNRHDGTVSAVYAYQETIDLLEDMGYDAATDGAIETDTLAVGGEPVHINVFDVDGDGFMDMLVANAGDGTISVVHGSADGLDGVETIAVAPAVTQAFINFNSFGRDLFVLAFSADGTLTELDFTGASLEVDKSEAGVFVGGGEARPRQVVVGEFTGDECIDVAVIDRAGEGVTIYVNVGCADGDDHDDDDDDDYGGPPFDAADIPVPGVPDLLPASDTGASSSDNLTAYNNAGEHTLLVGVKVGHVADALADLRAKLEAFFAAQGDQFDKDGFEYTPTIWLNLYAGDVYIGTAEVVGDEGTITVETDGFTVLRDGVHSLRAGFAIGAPGLRGLLGTRSAPLTIEVRTPRIDVESGDDGETVTILTDDEGNAVLVLDDGDGEAEQINLGSFGDLPAITGRVVTVRETKSNAAASRYAAGQSEEGLVLFVRAADGQWSGRNLTEEIEGAEPITASNIEVLTTPWGNVNMAGLNENGELVFYWQDGLRDGSGEFRWNYVNMTDDQLRANGQDVPEFASSLESFVTPWGAMNVAGIDDRGHLMVVWWAPGLNHWVSTDLTEHLGATPLVGDVSAYVTPWGGINLLGLNAEGEMVAVWWAPGHEWTVSNLGDLLDAPTFVHGSLASMVSQRGDTFVAGVTADGQVGLFTWTVDQRVWSYQQFAGIEAELVGAVTGYYDESAPALTLLVGSLAGDVYQIVGNPLEDGAWDIGLFDSGAEA